STNALAETRPSGQLPPAPKRRWWIAPLLGVAVLGAGATAFVVIQQQTHDDKPAQPAPPPSPSPPLKPAAATLAIDAPQPPAHSLLTLTDAPEGMEVLLDGKTVGIGGKAQLPYGTKTVLVVLQADGYVSAGIEVKPDHDQDVPVKLKKKA